MSRKVLILTDKKGWHFNQLEKSLNKLDFEVISNNISNLSLVISKNKSFVLDQYHNEIIVSCVIVRHIPGGNLEEIISYLNILKAFELNKIKVINTAVNIEKTVDKSLTSLLLMKNNILTPNTWVMNSSVNVKDFISNFSIPQKLVYKPLFGSQGDNIKIIDSINDINNLNLENSVIYLQEFIETKPSHDYRVLVIKNKSDYKMYAMTRYGDTYVNNYSKGARCELYSIDKTLKKLSLDIVDIFNIDFCGIDFIKRDSEFLTIEINSIPAWKGIQSVHDDNIAEKIVDILINKDIKYS